MTGKRSGVTRSGGIGTMIHDAGLPDGLVYSWDTDPGYRRRRYGRGVAYFAPDGARVTDPEVLRRISALAVPPAYRDVWIALDPRGHLQATGRDARGRKQYRYHLQWRTERARDKFSRVVDFGRRLPHLRATLRRDLALSGMPREKILAMAVSLLSDTLIRVGSAEYARANRSFGLTTLRDRHLTFAPGEARLRFRGKGGQAHEVAVTDVALRRLMRRCQQLPGQHLFQYLNDDGQPQPIDSGMVNDYLSNAMGGAFTAKDFRTWGGTVQAISVLSRTPLPRGRRAIASTLSTAVREIAGTLRNTPAVCRSSYIHPAVIDAWCDGSLHDALPALNGTPSRRVEGLVLRFLRRREKAIKRAPGR
jgi:DNA topoisomerase IB